MVEFNKQEKTKELTKNKSKPTISDIECCIDSCPLCIQSSEVWDSSLGVQNYPRKGKKKAAREEQTKVCIVCKKNKSEALYCIVQRPEKVVHLFSHIHQTYIIDSITVEEEDRDTEVTDPPSTKPLRWVTEEELHESAVSTAMKKNSKTPAKAKKQKVDKNNHPSTVSLNLNLDVDIIYCVF
ncbi:mutY [Mytilus edulis]|uniref:MutY n=1 Tax=Mytilus edulis TaxID=6550 RepID=A0A8S3PQ04_MYTED|nr:mutY [Mytilus edulis]